MESVFLTKESFNEDPYKVKFDNLKESSPALFKQFDNFFKDHIRKDMFESLCEHASELPVSVDDEDCIYIVELALDDLYSPEWFSWFMSITCKSDRSLPLEVILSVMQHFLDEGLSISDLSSLYDEYKDSPGDFSNLLYYKKDYSENDNSVDEHDSFERVDVVDPGSNTENKEIMKTDNEENVVGSENSAPEYSGVFAEMLDVITESHDFDRTSMQKDVQKHISALSSLFSDVFSKWSNQNNEMDRLYSLYQIQMKVMNYQQKKITEMSGIINDLRYQLSEADKLDVKREEMKKKLSEIQDLMAFNVDRIGAE